MMVGGGHPVSGHPVGGYPVGGYPYPGYPEQEAGQVKMMNAQVIGDMG